MCVSCARGGDAYKWRVLVFVRGLGRRKRGKMKERYIKEKDSVYKKERKGAGGVAVGCSQPKERWRPSRFLSVFECVVNVCVRGRARLYVFRIGELSEAQKRAMLKAQIVL